MIMNLSQRKLRDCSWCIACYGPDNMCNNPISDYYGATDRGYRDCKFNITPEELKELIEMVD